jgi:putative sterol carrier protein
MAELPLYWSEPYSQVFIDALHADEDFQKAAKKFDDKITLRCLDVPDGTDVSITYRIDHGRVSVAERVSEKAPSASLRALPFDKGSAMARTTAPYSLWVKLDKGEMSVARAIASPDYQVEGSKLKIMANIGVLNAMSAVGAKVPKRYA